MILDDVGDHLGDLDHEGDEVPVTEKVDTESERAQSDEDQPNDRPSSDKADQAREHHEDGAEDQRRPYDAGGRPVSHDDEREACDHRGACCDDQGDEQPLRRQLHGPVKAQVHAVLGARRSGGGAVRGLADRLDQGVGPDGAPREDDDRRDQEQHDPQGVLARALVRHRAVVGLGVGTVLEQCELLLRLLRFHLLEIREIVNRCPVRIHADVPP
mmetsp:Transcript_43240/g.130674  ORF Transcript_43240/g.130674 Transcript_43240/m.130674 type:complete len:214 (+) Transcript_43240:1037-1678(+)